MRKTPTPLALGVLALCGFAAAGGLALAQVVFFQTLAGTETMTVALPGAGSSGFTTTGRISSGRSYAYFTTFPNASFTIGANPAPGTTVSTAGMVTGGVLAFNVTNGTAITITMPPTASLLDGEMIAICNLTAAAWATQVVTVSANTGQTIVGTAATQTLTTLAASTCNKWLWNSGAATWFVAGASAL